MEGLDCFVTFTLDDQRYGLPLATVERVLPMVAVSPLPKVPAIALGVINLHGQILPVLDIRRRFGLPSRDFGLSGNLLLAKMPRRHVALPVDEVLGTLEVTKASVKRPLEILPGIGYVAGIIALPDGLLVIHDLEAFLSLEEEDRLRAALDEMQPCC